VFHQPSKIAFLSRFTAYLVHLSAMAVWVWGWHWSNLLPCATAAASAAEIKTVAEPVLKCGCRKTPESYKKMRRLTHLGDTGLHRLPLHYISAAVTVHKDRNTAKQ
jgi:hypothetical protein